MSLIYKGRVIRLHHEKKRLPNGRVASVDIIRHPGAVLIVPFLSKDRIIFLRQYRPAIDRYITELPAGTLNPCENALACARRELIEETGYAARRMRCLGSIFPVPGYSDEVIYIFRAQGLTRRFLEGDPDEVIRTRVVTRSEARQWVRRGRLHDAKTLAALALCGMA